jgi:hypothetical protein
MKTSIYIYQNHRLSLHPKSESIEAGEVDLLMCFGARSVYNELDVYAMIRKEFLSATIINCTTAGEIFQTNVLDNTLSITAISFAHTELKSTSVDIGNFQNSYAAGKELINKFDTEGLTYILVIADGSDVNGSELVRGMDESKIGNVLITGGLAGDGDQFKSTLVGLNEPPKPGKIIGIGFYGDKLKVGHGTRGGWEMFGLEKTVTRSHGNVLFEIDNNNALSLYKKYLGHEAESLPGSALLFPLSVKLPGQQEDIVRTILTIDEQAGSMTFAGDIPQGSKVRFMKANFDRLSNAAAHAANEAKINGSEFPQFALLISCIGRKLVLNSRIEEEVEAVDEIFNHKTLLAGFYSYGEISPFVNSNSCQLHNQTMTITTFYEEE